MQVQAKSTKVTWLYDIGGGVCGKFMSNKNHSADYEEINKPAVSTMAKDLKTKKKYKG